MTTPTYAETEHSYLQNNKQKGQHSTFSFKRNANKLLYFLHTVRILHQHSLWMQQCKKKKISKFTQSVQIWCIRHKLTFDLQPR
jgi:hypothetical protein